MRQVVNRRRLFILLLCLATCGIVNACSDDAPVLPADSSPQSVRDRLTSQDGDRFLEEISLHPWQNDTDRVTALFSWIPDDATSTDAGRRAMAGQTARALGQFLANNSNELRGGVGSETTKGSVGGVNPELTESYAAALVPYLGAMVGDPRGTSDFESLDPADGAMPRTVAAFAALQTGEAAAEHLSSALAQLVDEYESTFVESAMVDLASVQPGNPSLMRAARLLGAAKSSGFESVGEYALDAGDVAAQLQYRLARSLVDGPNTDISPQFFDRSRLLSPNEVRDQLGEASWDEYTNQLSVLLSKRPQLSEAVTHFRTTFMTSSQ